VRIFYSLILACCLLGCATKEQIDAQKLPLTRLSPPQMATVQLAVRAVLPRSDGRYFFKGYRAGKNPDGTIMVCGWATGPDNEGFPSHHVYTGVLSLKGEFTNVRSAYQGTGISLACFIKGVGLQAWED
jgi:hypothetical protein